MTKCTIFLFQGNQDQLLSNLHYSFSEGGLILSCGRMAEILLCDKEKKNSKTFLEKGVWREQNAPEGRFMNKPFLARRVQP